MALIATPGSATADSYILQNDADAYFDNQRATREAWDSVLNHEELLRTACLILEQFDYIGDRATTTQALSWPRVINDTYELAHDEFPYADNVIPTKIKYAQCEIAYWLAETGGTVAASGSIDSMKIGDDVEIKYAASSSASVVSATVDYTGIPLQAARYLKGLRLYSVLA